MMWRGACIALGLVVSGSAMAQTTYRAGDRVEVKTAAGWWAGTVARPRPDYGDAYDVKLDRSTQTAIPTYDGKDIRPLKSAPAAPASSQAQAPADAPMGEYAVYQMGGTGQGLRFQYSYRFTLEKGGRYRVRDNERGTYSYDAKSKRLRFTSGPLQGFGGLYYTKGRNAEGPTIALSPTGAVDLVNASLGQYQYAYYRPNGV